MKLHTRIVEDDFVEWELFFYNFVDHMGISFICIISIFIIGSTCVEEKNENLFEKNQKQSNQLDSNYDMIGMRSGTKDETADEEAKDLLTSYASAMERLYVCMYVRTSCSVQKDIGLLFGILDSKALQPI